MLIGRFIYVTDDEADVTLEDAIKDGSQPYMDLRGYDLAQSTTLQVTIPDKYVPYFQEGIVVDDAGTVEYPRWENVPVSIGSVNVSVEAPLLYGRFESPINKEAFSLLGGLTQGIKGLCEVRNRKDFYELGYSDQQFNPRQLQEHIIEPFGEIGLVSGSIDYLSAAHGRAGIELRDDGQENIEFFPPPSNGIKVKLEIPKKETSVEVEQETLDISTSSEGFLTLKEIIANNPNKNFSWLFDRDYHIVKPDEVEEVVKYLMDAPEVLAFDTETTGLNVNFKSLTGDGDVAVGFVFSVKEGESFYFPLRHRKIQNICSPEEIPYYMGQYFKPLLEKRRVLAHNASFDWKVAYSEGINANIKEDTLILFQLSLRNAGEINSVGLKQLSETILGRDSLELSDFLPGGWGTGDLNFADMDEESVKYYACADTDNTIALKNWAVENNVFEVYNIPQVYQLETDFARAIGYQEFYGHGMPPEEIQSLGIRLEAEIADHYAKMVEMAGSDFNPNSHPQLRDIMFGKLGAPVIKETGTGAPSLDKSVLRNFVNRDESEGEFVAFSKILAEYRDASKLYTDLIKNLDKLATPDGFFFSGVRAFLETGRLSVSEPNYQSYSDTVKEYVRPRKDFYMVDMDYSAIEYRVLSSMAGQKNLIEAFRDPDNDYHTLQASRMFGVPYEFVTPKLRDQAKGFNFGIPYGLGIRGLADYVFGSATEENVKKAKILYEKYFEGQDEVREFFRRARSTAVDVGWTDTYFGRRRYFDPRSQRRDTIERAGANHRIQGTAADIYKLGVGRLFQNISDRGLLGKILLSAFVHDETVLEVHKSISPFEILTLLRESAMLEIDGWSPLFIGMGFGRNWYEAKSTELPVQLQESLKQEDFDWWNGSLDDLLEWEQTVIANYERDRVVTYLESEDSWGETIDPVILGHLRSALKNAERYWASGKKERFEDFTGSSEMPSVKTGNLTPVETMEVFGQIFGVSSLVESANYKDPDLSVNTEIELKPAEGQGADPTYAEGISEDTLFSMISFRGIVFDYPTKRIYFYFSRKPEDLPMMEKLSNRVAEINAEAREKFGEGFEENTLSLVAVDADSREILPTQMRIPASSLREMQQIWAAYRR